MGLEIDEFESFFRSLNRGEGNPRRPFPWQSRLARRVHGEGWPACIDLPVASGKTACIDIAVFVLACQAERPAGARTVGRRIFYTVNRRLFADEALRRAGILAEKLRDAKGGILGRVAKALLSLNEDASRDNANALPLDFALLLGGIPGDRRWARSLTQPMIVCTTADQLGSRLLFRGYGVSPAVQPIHAALTAYDSLILLDEAHVTRALCQTLLAAERYRARETLSPPSRVVQVTALPTGSVAPSNRFILDSADLGHPLLGRWHSTPKPVELVSLGDVDHAATVSALVDLAVQSVNEQRRVIGVFVNRIQTARDVYAGLSGRAQSEPDRKPDVHLVMGCMRRLDQAVLEARLGPTIGAGRNASPKGVCFVVATQCLEVGADYDFDALITECAAIDALRQRFGRLNRRGRAMAAMGAIVASEEGMKEEDPVYGAALRETWKWLSDRGRQTIDFSNTALQPLWDALSDDERGRLISPACDAAVLLPAHLDAWCQTGPQPVPSPDVSCFIHGRERGNAEVQVCWRGDLGFDSGDWIEIVSMLPPRSGETMTVSLRALRHWMKGEGGFADADVPMRAEDATAEESAEVRKVLIWRGARQSRTTTHPDDVRPGDTIVLSTRTRSCQALGQVPDDVENIDIAEAATATASRSRCIRIHLDLPRGEIDPRLYAHAASEDGTCTPAEVRALLRLDATASFEQVPYPAHGGRRRGLLIWIHDVLPPPRGGAALPFSGPLMDEEDEDEARSTTGIAVSLKDHARHVENAMERALRLLPATALEACLRRAAALHDLGKADVRFQAMLLGSTPQEAGFRPALLGKSRRAGLSQAQRRHRRDRAGLPDGFRHEMLSVQIVEANAAALVESTVDLDTLLHLIAAHHGFARPFAPVVVDDGDDDLLEVSVDHLTFSGAERRRRAPAHRLDSGVPGRFWRLIRRQGWWGLAWLESILRMADQQASELELENLA